VFLKIILLVCVVVVLLAVCVYHYIYSIYMNDVSLLDYIIYRSHVLRHNNNIGTDTDTNPKEEEMVQVDEGTPSGAKPQECGSRSGNDISRIRPVEF
jgi:hypothetical protein